MNNKNIILGGLLVIVSIFALKNSNFLDNKKDDLFTKKTKCASYTELAHTKIKESGRVFSNDSYTLNEVFYSPKKDTCLYAYTITSPTSGELYSIYDLFGGSILVLSDQNPNDLDVSSYTTFQDRLYELKN